VELSRSRGDQMPTPKGDLGCSADEKGCLYLANQLRNAGGSEIATPWLSGNHAAALPLQWTCVRLCQPQTAVSLVVVPVQPEPS